MATSIRLLTFKAYHRSRFMNPTEKQIALCAVAERIRKIRLLKDMTIKEVAAHLQITTQAYGNIENGKTDTSISRLVELASLFEIPVTRLITLDHYSSIITPNFGEPVKINFPIRKPAGE